MKKNLLILIILISGYNAYTQDERGGINIEVKMSPELANISHNIIDTDFKFAFSGGVYAEKEINAFLNVLTGVLYKNRGFKTTASITDMSGVPLGEEEVKSSLNYLSFPVLVKFKLNKFYGSIGPSLDLFLNQRSDFSSNAENIRKLNSSLHIAAGYRLDLKEGLFLNIEAKYSPMLISVQKTSNFDMKAYNFGLGFGLGFSL